MVDTKIHRIEYSFYYVFERKVDHDKTNLV